VVGLGQVGSSSYITDAYGYRYERDAASFRTIGYVTTFASSFAVGDSG
jgi:hypothetical protein